MATKNFKFGSFMMGPSGSPGLDAEHTIRSLCGLPEWALGVRDAPRSRRSVGRRHLIPIVPGEPTTLRPDSTLSSTFSRGRTRVSRCDSWPLTLLFPGAQHVSFIRACLNICCIGACTLHPNTRCDRSRLRHSALKAFFAWRNGRAWRAFIISTPDFPVGYYADGDHTAQCEVVRDEPGNDLKFCEDATFWDRVDDAGGLQDRILLMSCDPGRREWNTVMGPLHDPVPAGALWVHRTRDATGRPQRVVFEKYPQGHDFHPLGAEVYPSHPGKASNLFVVNHARQETTIEQFTMQWDTPARATWVRTLSSPYFVSPNALALTSPTSFYVTNDHLLTRRLPSVLGQTLPLAETLLGLPLGWLAHVTVNDPAPGEAPTITHSLARLGIPFANGVSISPDGATVAVASTSLGQVLFYTRNASTNALAPAARVPTPFTPDNIAFDDAGALLVAGHPHFPSLTAVARNVPGARAPSWAMALTPRPQAPVGAALPDAYDTRAPVPAARKAPPARSHEAQTLYQSDGTAFSSSSTALRDATTGKLYVTGLYEEGFLVCAPDKASRGARARG